MGYVGRRDAGAILMTGLSRLEYRGYDSAGIAVQNGKGIGVRKVHGRVLNLRALVGREPVTGTSGVGHTRWATHGRPSTLNAHPHTDCTETIVLVHNGVIENCRALKTRLLRTGHVFRTETDTETLAHLIEESAGDTLEQRVAEALRHVEGTYGIAVMSSADPGKIVAARQGSPVLLGLGADPGEYYVASDASAVLEHTRTVVYLSDGDVAVVTRDGYRIMDHDSRAQDRTVTALDWELEAIELGGYRHFMLKEIHEQPETVHRAMRGRLSPQTGSVRLDGLRLAKEECEQIRRVVIMACGTSWHAGLIGRHIIEQLAELPVQVEYASEYHNHAQLTGGDALAIAISQSGETADTLEAMRAARASGATVASLVNVVGSTIARESRGGIFLHAGPEIGVASTKAFTSQIVTLLMLGMYLREARGFDGRPNRALAQELKEIPLHVHRALQLEPEIRRLAALYHDAKSFLYLGRGINFPVALEGALKLKEISYIHAEGYPAAEMKHGPIALIHEGMPVVFIAPSDGSYSRVVANMQEVKARGARVIVVRSEGSEPLGGLADHELCVPATSMLVSPLMTVIPLQLLAYHIGVLKGCDVDRPRNLAKSVTVH